MKRKLLLLSILVIGAAALSTGSFAYFNVEGETHNVITTAGVEVEVQEWADAKKETRFTNPVGVMPNQNVTKIAEVANTGTAKAWVRVRITKTIQLQGSGTPDTSLIKLNLNTENWTSGADGYLYYNDPLDPGEVTEPVFTTVTFDKSMGNEYQDATATVVILAQAVQVDHNGSSVSNAVGWPNE